MSRSGLALMGALSLVGCFPLPAEIPSAPRSFDAAEIEGTWYILATNFPTWTSGENTETHLVYKQRSAAEGVVEMDDRVEFLHDGEPSSYVGFDTQDPANATHFTWRGNGLLALFPTEWYVALVDPRGRWLVTYYSDTVPALHAVDVIARTPHLSDEDLTDALDAIDRDPFLKPRAAGMKRVHLYEHAAKNGPP
ncbi:MAG: hypothetical protein U0414_25325 [Polyangiaceae bacterium]